MNQNPFSSFNDFFKGADMFKSALDFNQAFSSQRRNVEAWSSAGQVMVEGAQAVSRAGAEAMRSNMEAVLKSSKDAMSGGTPDMSKQADVVRSVFENTLANLREISEMATKCGFEAFQVLNERASESLEELSQPARAKKR